MHAGGAVRADGAGRTRDLPRKCPRHDEPDRDRAMLEESVSDHRHKRMTVQTLPGSSLEVIETEFFFHLLVSLLANPSRRVRSYFIRQRHQQPSAQLSRRRLSRTGCPACSGIAISA